MTSYYNYNPLCPDNPEHGRMYDTPPFRQFFCPHSDHSRGLAKSMTGLFPASTEDPSPLDIAKAASKAIKSKRTKGER